MDRISTPALARVLAAYSRWLAPELARHANGVSTHPALGYVLHIAAGARFELEVRAAAAGLRRFPLQLGQMEVYE